jgi:cytidylate kinase
LSPLVSFSVICISATDGANAAQVATALGATLGFPVINEEIVVRAAAEAGVDRQAIVNVEQRKTMLTKLLDRVVLGAGATEPDFVRSTDQQIEGSTLGVSLNRTSTTSRPSDELRGLIRSAIDEYMASGDVVILQHAAAHSLAGREKVLRVFVTASPSTRSARLAESHQVDAKHADALVKKGDGNRADYLKRFYGIEQELPTQYDFVVNTDKMTPEQAAAAIAGVATSADATTA